MKVLKHILVFLGVSLCYLSHSQNNSLFLSGGYSYQAYQFQIGHGYNLNLGFESPFKNSKFRLGAEVFLSNTYAFTFGSERFDEYEAVIGGGLNYVDFPEGVEETFPLDNNTYLGIMNQGNIKHLKPKEEYFHNFFLNVYLRYLVLNSEKVNWSINSGIGLGIANSSMALSSYEGVYEYGPPRIPEATELYYTIERNTRNIYYNISFSIPFEYNINHMTGIFFKPTLSIAPGNFWKENSSNAYLLMYNLGLRVSLFSGKGSYARSGK